MFLDISLLHLFFFSGGRGAGGGEEPHTTFPKYLEAARLFEKKSTQKIFIIKVQNNLCSFPYFRTYFP